jgi:hypothetical protein
VVGLKLGQARLKIRRHKCSVGAVTRRQSPRVGRILRQIPRVGVKRRNFPIALVVGRR